MRIGFLSNARIRDNGTFMLVRDAVTKTDKLPCVRFPSYPIQVGDTEWKWYQRGEGYEEDCDFYIFVDDGRDDIPMDVPRPNVAWMIDTHLGWDVRREWANHFDTVFCAQRGDAEKMSRDGVNAHWLPLACHPPAHPNFGEIITAEARDQILQGRGLDKQHDLCFVGYINEDAEGNNRLEYLDTMFEAFPNSWLAVDCFHEWMAAHYIRSRIGFNISIRDDLNMRFFEVLSTGTALLTNTDVDGWEDLGFVDGEHFIGYVGVEDAIEKTKYYLKHHDERERIAAAGHRLAREKHTYADRMREMFNICNVEIPDAQAIES